MSNNIPHHPNPNRANEIDLLRFLAACAVMFFHYAFRGYAADGYSLMPLPEFGFIAKYGYLGVDLFFIISGFVIFMSAEQGTFKRFFISRVTRLYPAFWTCCTITFIATLLIGGTRFSATLSQYIINLSMLNEFFSVQPIDGAYWSLAIEIKFYALISLILIFRQMKRAQLFLAFWLAMTIAIEVFNLNYLRSSILIPNYASYFIAGAAAYLIWSRGITIPRISLFMVAWLTALYRSSQVAGDVAKYYRTDIDQIIVSLLISSFFAATLLISIRKTGFFIRKKWGLLGVMTYPLYLIHQYIGYMIFNLAYPTFNRYAIILTTISLMLLMAFLINVFVEKKWRGRFSRLLNSLLESTGKLLKEKNS